MSIWNQNGHVTVRVKRMIKPTVEPDQVRLNCEDEDPLRAARAIVYNTALALGLWAGIITVGFFVWSAWGPFLAAMFRGLP